MVLTARTTRGMLSTTAFAVAALAPGATRPPLEACPALYALGIRGTGEFRGLLPAEKAAAESAAPARFVADRFAAAACARAAGSGVAAPPKGGPSSPVTGFSGLPSGASSSPNSSGTGQFPFGTGPGASAPGAVTTVPSAGTADHNYPFSTN